MNLHVLLEAAFLVELSATYLAEVRFLTSMNPFMSLQMSGAFKAFAAVRTDEALLKHQPLHRPPPHGVPMLTETQQPTAERVLLKPAGAGAAVGRGHPTCQRRPRKARQRPLLHRQII